MLSVFRMCEPFRFTSWRRDLEMMHMGEFDVNRKLSKLVQYRREFNFSVAMCQHMTYGLRMIKEQQLGRRIRPTNIVAVQIGRRITKRRSVLSMSRLELCAILSIVKQQLERWEHGKVEPSVTTVKRLAKALKCKAGWLAYGDEE